MSNEAKKFDAGKAPVVQGFLHYFPRAIRAVALVSEYGKSKYDVKFEDQNWRGLDPNRLLDADGRHLIDEAIDGKYDPESGQLHAAHHAWEAMARLELMLEGGLPVAVVESPGLSIPASWTSDEPAKQVNRACQIDGGNGEDCRFCISARRL